MSFLRALRKLVLGETWALPLGVAGAVAAAGAVRVLAGPDGWFEYAGGAILVPLLLLALARSLRFSDR